MANSKKEYSVFSAQRGLVMDTDYFPCLYPSSLIIVMTIGMMMKVIQTSTMHENEEYSHSEIIH